MLLYGAPKIENLIPKQNGLKYICNISFQKEKGRTTGLLTLVRSFGPDQTGSHIDGRAHRDRYLEGHWLKDMIMCQNPQVFVFTLSALVATAAGWSKMASRWEGSRCPKR